MSKYKINFLSYGSLFFLTSLLLSLVGYFSHYHFLHYLSFLSLLSAIILLLLYLKCDLAKVFHPIIVYIILLLLISIYIYQRLALPHFFFSVLDASNYYTAGVSAVLKENDIGFFLPLTSAVSATGFKVLGYDYGIAIMSMVYFPSTVFIYYIFKKFGLNTVLSMGMVFLFISIPLDIWISKTSFSEPLWQVLLLCFVVILYILSHQKKLTFQTYSILILTLFILAFSRGEAILLYGAVFSLSMYHIWKYNNLKSAFILLSSLIFLIIGIYLTLQVREMYLLKYQFSRIIVDINAEYLIGIMFGFLFFMLIVIAILNQTKKRFDLRWFTPTMVFLLLLFKVLASYILSIKQHTSFMQLLVMNEYSFMIGHFGSILTGLIFIGMMILYVKASKGDVLSLIAITLYSLLYIPFIMQDSTFSKEHEFFLYWSRYYFSFIMVIHVLAIGVLVKTLYDFSNKYIKTHIYINTIFITLMLGTSFLSINTNLYSTVTKEAYLDNSYRLFPWLAKRIGNHSLSIVYATDIKFRNYGVKRLMGKGFNIAGINVTYYRQVRAKEFSKKLHLPTKTFNSKYLLCLSQTTCTIANKKALLIDTIQLPISWIKDSSDSKRYKKSELQLNAYLFQL